MYIYICHVDSLLMLHIKYIKEFGKGVTKLSGETELGVLCGTSAVPTMASHTARTVSECNFNMFKCKANKAVSSLNVCHVSDSCCENLHLSNSDDNMLTCLFKFVIYF